MDAEHRKKQRELARQAKTLAELRRRAEEAPLLTPEMLAELARPTKGVFKAPQDQRAARQTNWRHQAAKRHAAKLQRTPPWADLDAIRALHAEAKRLTDATGVDHHVDHVIPLQGRLVSGLHVHTNMQILRASDNCSKWNRFDPENFPAQVPAE